MEIFHFAQLDTLTAPTTPSAKTRKSSKAAAQDDKKSFHCEFPNCGKIFKFKSELTRHNVIHYNSRPFPCPHPGCGKTFKRADALDAHSRLHTKEMPFDCDFPGCDKKFPTKAALKYHLLRHNNERCFTCSFPGCDKSFYTKGQLKQHENALNYHINLTGANGIGKIETNMVKTLEESESQYQDFEAPTPKVIQDIEFEIKNLPIESFNEEVTSQDNFENETKYVLGDEKEKLDLATEIMGNFQEDDENNFRISNDEEWSDLMKEPSVFFDENEFKILDFLKEQAHTNYY